MSSYSDPFEENTSVSTQASATKATSQNKNSEKIPSNPLKVFLTKILIILSLCGLFYLVQFFNAITRDQLDSLLSLYPRAWKSLLCIFSCPFVHDDYAHLNALIVFFLVCAFCVILRGNRRFWYISAVVIVVGNLLSWIFGVGRMNGISGWTFGLLGYIYFSVITDIGYPVKCSLHGVKALVIAVLVSIALGFMWKYHLIPTQTACWQYNLSGALAGVFAAYLFTSTSLAVDLGIIPQERYDLSVSTPTSTTQSGQLGQSLSSSTYDQDDSYDDDASNPPKRKRVVVAKNLIKFNDLRKPLV